MTILQGQARARAPSEQLLALPYLAAIAVLVLISHNSQVLAPRFPASLARPSWVLFRHHSI